MTCIPCCFRSNVTVIPPTESTPLHTYSKVHTIAPPVRQIFLENGASESGFTPFFPGKFSMEDGSPISPVQKRGPILNDLAERTQTAVHSQLNGVEENASHGREPYLPGHIPSPKSVQQLIPECGFLQRTQEDSKVNQLATKCNVYTSLKKEMNRARNDELNNRSEQGAPRSERVARGETPRKRTSRKESTRRSEFERLIQVTVWHIHSKDNTRPASPKKFYIKKGTSLFTS